jgi:hypothetical protein
MNISTSEEDTFIKYMQSTRARIVQLKWYSNRLQAGWLGFDSQQRLVILLFSTVSRPALVPIQPMGTRGFFLRLK